MKRPFLLIISLLIILPALSNSEIILEKKWELAQKDILMPVSLEIYEGKLFVLDEGVIKVLSDGKYINKIGKTGQGPGEFIQLIDFKIKDDFLYCLDQAGSKVEKFNLDGKYLDGFKINIPNAYQLDIGNKIYINHIGMIEYLISVYNWGKSTPEKKFLKAKEITNPLDFKQLYRNFGLMCWSDEEEKLYFGYVLNNVLLRVDTEKGEIEEIVLPCRPPSGIEIEKKSGMALLKNALIYDIKAYNGKVYVLVNEKNKRSAIYEISKKEIEDIYRFDVELIKFAYDKAEKEFYGIEKEDFKVFKFGRSEN